MVIQQVLEAAPHRATARPLRKANACNGILLRKVDLEETLLQQIEVTLKCRRALKPEALIEVTYCIGIETEIKLNSVEDSLH